ncbi:hypothetical protein MYAER_1190 [Microcystis aeruginosa NIES-2549]|uniref:Uncharacterized protein n=1 Tax=Microcystis aeruginosa NIES-2549 TaxID=1641812 RepID=A0A0F6RKJ6_MICAE|nr:hypothetical protein MYAER_1190 [Microcystis aeruginosa NIES-2549]AOC51944.1 hypothetical protein amyaer_1207 [Microcystis aeruginosa NIES-2481]
MVYLPILCRLILIFDVFKPSKINYARGRSKKINPRASNLLK